MNADLPKLSAVGTRRRLQALRAAGWPNVAIAAALEVPEDTLAELVVGTLEVWPGVMGPVAALYDRWWRGPQPGDRVSELAAAESRAEAVGAKWAPALAWDDDRIDKPGARPTGVRRRSSRVRLEDVEWLARSGLSLDVIAERIGTTPTRLDRWVRRRGDPAWARRLRLEPVNSGKD